MNNLSTSKLTTKLSLAALLCGLGAGSVQAVTLNLSLDGTPDIKSSFLQVDYLDATDSLVVSGGADTLDLGSGGQSISGGTFSLNATIDSAGTLVSGSFSIGGSVGSYSGPSLLTGSLTQFGYNNLGTLDFLFTVTGGDLAGEYGNVGGQGGLILSYVLDSAAAPLGGFVGDFTGDSMANADAKKLGTAVPDQTGSFALLSIGLATVVAGRRSGLKFITRKA